MKKLLVILSLVLVLSLMLSTVCAAAGGSTTTLAAWDLKVTVPEGKASGLKGDEFYIYAQKEGSIPYVMIRIYKFESEEKFFAAFTEYMQRQHADLKVTLDMTKKTIAGRTFYEVDYAYDVQGNLVKDRRLAAIVNGITYLFTSKEVEARGMTVGTLLEDVIKGCVFLAEEPAPTPAPAGGDEPAAAYLYCREDGMPKYWLDLTGKMSEDDLVLHCFFRSGEPTFYETVFYLSLSDAESRNGALAIHTVRDAYGFDCSGWFKALTLRLENGEAVLNVERDESTLAGGGEDNVLTGEYRMTSVGARVEYSALDRKTQVKTTLSAFGDQLLLRAELRNGGVLSEETVYRLDLTTAEEENEYTTAIRTVYDEAGCDVSDRFKSMTLTEVQGAIMLNVKRDESTVDEALGADVLSGVTMLEPHTAVRPAGDGPFTAEELGRWAQIRYFVSTGYYPPEADVEKNADGTYTIHLYEMVEAEGMTHTATSAWYTVDAYGVGRDDVFDKDVDLKA